MNLEAHNRDDWLRSTSQLGAVRGTTVYEERFAQCMALLESLHAAELVMDVSRVTAKWTPTRLAGPLSWHPGVVHAGISRSLRFFYFSTSRSREVERLFPEDPIKFVHDGERAALVLTVFSIPIYDCCYVVRPVIKVGRRSAP